MTEAVLAREQVKEFPARQAPRLSAFTQAEFPQLVKHFLVRHRPRDTRHWNSEHKQPDDLRPNRHSLFGLNFSEQGVPDVFRFSRRGTSLPTVMLFGAVHPRRRLLHSRVYPACTMSGSEVTS